MIWILEVLERHWIDKISAFSVSLTTAYFPVNYSCLDMEFGVLIINMY